MEQAWRSYQKSSFGQVVFVTSSGHPKETTNKQLDIQLGVPKPEPGDEIYELSAYRSFNKMRSLRTKNQALGHPSVKRSEVRGRTSKY